MRYLCFVLICESACNSYVLGGQGDQVIADISFPYQNDRVRGLVPVYGIAGGKDFKQYRLEFGEGENPDKWDVLKVSRDPRPVDPFSSRQIRWNPNYGTRGNLGDWEVGAPPYEYSTWKRNLNGRYTLRLVVENQKGEIVESRVTVSVGQTLTFIDGGTVTSPDEQVRLTAPPHSLVYGPFVVVCLFPTTKINPPRGYQAVGSIYEFRPPNFQAIRPMQLSFRYQIGDLDFDKDGRSDAKPDGIGLYYYEPVEQVWVRYREQSQPSVGVVNATFTRAPRYVSYVAVLADTSAPKAPLLLAREKHGRLLRKNAQGILESTSPWINFFGRAEPDAVVHLRSGDTEIATTEADLTGRFSFQDIWLDTEPIGFNASAVDRTGQESPPSHPLQCRWKPAGGQVSSLSILGATKCKDNDWIVIKAETKVNEETTDKDASGSLTVRVRSAVTDPDGISLELRPVTGRTGIYLGSFQIGSQSDAHALQLAARIHKEAIRIEMAGKDMVAELNYEDRVGPAAPSITSTTHPSVLQTWFDAVDEPELPGSQPVLGWKPLDGKFGAQLSIRNRKEQPESEGNAGTEVAPKVFLHAKSTPRFPNHLGLDLPVEPFQVSDFPILSFDYRFHPELPLDLLLKTVKHGWKGIRLAGTHPPLYERLASPDDIKADGQWHHAQVSLERILKDAYPAEPDWEIQAIRFQSLKMGGYKSLEPGLSFADYHIYYDLARFNILRYGSGTRMHLKWTAEDPNEIAGYSVTLNREPWTIPEPLEEPLAENERTIDQLERGTWFFHVRAVDGGGNWGKTAHYELRVSSNNPGSIAFATSDRPTLKWPAPVVLTVADSQNLIPQSLVIRVAGRRFTTAERALSYEVDSGKLIFQPDLVEPSALIFPDGISVPVVVEEAAGFDGASLAEPFRFDVTYQLKFLIENSNSEMLAASPKAIVPGANLPSTWFRNRPQVRVKNPPEGSSFRWLPQPDLKDSVPQIRELEFRFPSSWFSGPAQLANRGKDFIPCVWSFGLLPDETKSEDAFAWHSGGLLGSYFKGPLPKSGNDKDALLQRVDPTVFYSMNDALALPVVSQARSVRWQGMLYVPFTDEWSFELYMRGSPAIPTMKLGDETVLTTKDQWHPEVISGRRFLKRGFYPVLIEVNSSSPNWYLEWFWEAEDWRTRRHVSAEYLFARIPLKSGD